jgi:hypothetical protein
VKFVPEIVTVEPTAPLRGLKLVMDGVGNTVKLDELVIVTPLVITEIGPSRAPAGTTVVILVVVEDVTLATTPLNDTEGDPLKFVPEIITVAPTAPLTGLKPVIVGVARTVKFEELETVTPLTVTDINPDVAPGGTVVVMLVAVEEETVASVPLKRTIFSVGVVLKLVPVMVMVVPSAPLLGVKLEMVGEATTIKLVGALFIVTPLVVTEIGPDAAPEGTEVVMLVAFEDVTVALMPLKATVGEGPKFVPVIMTTAPGAPLPGLNPVMVGVGRTVNDGPVIVTPFNVTVTDPVVAPAGTDVVNFLPLGFESVTTASVPLNLTTFCEAVVLKLSPFIVTVAPTAPLVGLRLVITGVGNKVKPVLVAVPPGVVTDTLPEAPLATTAEI